MGHVFLVSSFLPSFFFAFMAPSTLQSFRHAPPPPPLLGKILPPLPRLPLPARVSRARFGPRRERGGDVAGLERGGAEAPAGQQVAHGLRGPAPGLGEGAQAQTRRASKQVFRSFFFFFWVGRADAWTRCPPLVERSWRLRGWPRVQQLTGPWDGVQLRSAWVAYSPESGPPQKKQLYTCRGTSRSLPFLGVHVNLQGV